MKIFDFNIHLYDKTLGNLQKGIVQDTEMSVADINASLDKNKEHILANCSAGNFMFFNTQIFKENGASEIISRLKNEFNNSSATLLYDFRSADFKKELEDIKALGFFSIKFHSYIQKIGESDFNVASAVAKHAESLGLAVCIDCSYGTAELYTYDNLKLAAAISQQVKKTPIILLHSGGLRCMEALLIAEECNNFYLETSLSLEYYHGNRVVDDLAFAYHKLGPNRVLYASDYPYVPMDQSVITIQEFATKYFFTEEETEKIVYSNAIELIQNA